MNGNYSLIWLVVLVLDIVALVNIFKSAMDTERKLLWAFAVLAAPVLGMILYFIFKKDVIGKIEADK